MKLKLNLIKKGLIVYLILMIMSILVQSCIFCDPTKVEIIGNGDLIIRQNDNLRQDTIRNDFTLFLKVQRKFTNHFINTGFISTSYAFTCPEDYQNSFMPESFEVSCTKDFMYDGELIASDTDFSDIAELFINIWNEEGCITIIFNQDFLNKAEFEKGEQKFRVKIDTDNGLRLVNKVETVLNL